MSQCLKFHGLRGGCFICGNDLGKDLLSLVHKEYVFVSNLWNKARMNFGRTMTKVLSALVGYRMGAPIVCSLFPNWRHTNHPLIRLESQLPREVYSLKSPNQELVFNMMMRVLSLLPYLPSFFVG